MDESDEDEDSSTSSSTFQQVLYSSIDRSSPLGTSYDKSELESFREKWRQELIRQKETHVNDRQSQDRVSNELYKLAVLHEQRGMVSEAVNLYRQAFKIFPEIEQRFRRPLQDRNTSLGGADSEPSQSKFKPEWLKSSQENVYHEFDTKIFKSLLPVGVTSLRYCTPAKPSTFSIHIGSLPAEILMHIFKWVISSHLDLRQLEQLSMVCRGFYVLSRDQELWKLACYRMWPLMVENSHYTSWRQMYLSRPHLLYTGVYISKITYIRRAEDNSFYDRCMYQQWHLVSYYRYLRFFPDGGVMMVTSSEEPSVVLPTLRSKSNFHNAALVGTFKLTNDVDKSIGVSAVLRRASRKQFNDTTVRRSSDRCSGTDQTFFMEFRFKPSKKRGNFHLIWHDYSIQILYSSGQDPSSSRLTLSDKNFPPLYFSRVRSYTTVCDNILQ